MKLPAILAADLHLTANPIDAYRWGLFPWLAREGASARAETLVLLGDLTDAKDYHPAELVNRVVREVVGLREAFGHVIILKGNHDELKAGNMYFQFLEALDGVEVVSAPREIDLGWRSMFLPFTRAPAKDWAGLDLSPCEYVFLHQTLKGAVASNGQRMEGELLPALGPGKAYSGDIHVPQVIGGVEYVGSPYHVHFGDNFAPRCVLLGNGWARDLHYPSIKRVTLDIAGEDGLQQIARLAAGDQVKVRMHLSESERHGWREWRHWVMEACQHQGVMLCGLELKVARRRARVRVGDRPVQEFDPAAALYRYVDEDGLGGELLDIGLECIGD